MAAYEEQMFNLALFIFEIIHEYLRKDFNGALMYAWGVTRHVVAVRASFNMAFD
jgi:hypothetical protein